VKKLKANYFATVAIKLFFTFFYLFPTSLFAGDTLPENLLEKALQIEYSLILSKYDSLVDYSGIPYKKILTVREGEALIEFAYLDSTRNAISYYDLDSAIVYKEFAGLPLDSLFFKNKWEKPGKVLEVSKKAFKPVVEKRCKAYRCELFGDTLLVFSTTELGFEFNDYTGMEGIPLEYEFIAGGRYKLKYRAVNIDTVYFPQRDLFYGTAAKIVRVEKPSERQLKAANKQFEHKKKTQQKMIESKAPSFKTTTLAGREINSKKLRGKILVLNFWFTNCRPCIQEMPELNKVRTLYKEDDEVVFLSLCRDGQQKVEAILSKVSLDYEICPDAMHIAERFRVMVYPLNLVINREGKIIGYESGLKMDLARRLVDAIELAKIQGE
jgi:peroxiredoxin